MSVVSRLQVGQTSSLPAARHMSVFESIQPGSGAHDTSCLMACLLTPRSPTSEANRCSASQEILSTSCNLKVHYLIHKCLPPVPILSHLDPVIHSPISHFLKIHSNILIVSPKWSSFLQVSPPKS